MKNRMDFKCQINLFFALFLFSGCAMFGKEQVPYIVKGDMTISCENNEFQTGGVDLYFYNKSDKRVSEFTVVFNLFDEDGEPISNGRSNIVLNIRNQLEPGEIFEDCISLDKYLYEVPDYPYQIDYLYVSRIKYEDETSWTDAFGVYAN